MSSNSPNSADAPGSSTSGSGFLTPDAGPDTSRADYSDALAPDKNDSSHDDDNVDEQVPNTAREDSNTNVVDRQLGVISRLPG